MLSELIDIEFVLESVLEMLHWAIEARRYLESTRKQDEVATRESVAEIVNLS